MNLPPRMDWLDLMWMGFGVLIITTWIALLWHMFGG